MNGTLSTSARVLHDLGLATSVGGAIFGKAGLHRAVRKIPSSKERALVTSEAWRDFTPLNLLAHTAVVLTWSMGRARLSGRVVDRSTRTLVRAKDALIAIYLATGLTSAATGYAQSRANDAWGPASLAGEADDVSARGAGEGSRRLQRTSAVAGYVNLAAGAAIVGVTAVLAAKAGRSLRWSAVSRLFP